MLLEEDKAGAAWLREPIENASYGARWFISRTLARTSLNLIVLTHTALKEEDVSLYVVRSRVPARYKTRIG